MMSKKKRLFDVLLAFTLIVICSPLFILIFLYVFLFVGHPVIFIQQRPGLNSLPFNIYKFRSMTNERDTHGQLLPDAIRLNFFGRLLRATSLDEIPSLVNVLKGDMSFVGPRPLLMEYLPLYTAEQARRHDVKPGITGWAQVNGRNLLTWEKKFEYDVWYVENQSTYLDLKILLLTVKKVFLRSGINQVGEATMSKFKGGGNL